MENQVKTYLKIWNWFIFTALTFLCGGFVGAVTVSFLQIMRFAINLLWAKVPQSFFCIVIFGIKINLYYVILCIAGGVLIGIWQRKYGDYPILLEDILKIYKRDKNIPYNNLGIVFVAALMPLIFGGSVGPEAGLAGIIAMLFCWVRDKYKSSIVYILQNKEKKKRTRLFELIKNPINTFIGVDIIYDDQTYTVSKIKRWSAYLSAAVGGVLAFRIIAKILAHEGIKIAKFGKFVYTSHELLYFLPIVLLGILTGLIFLFSKKLFNYIFKPLKNKKVLRAVICGLILSLVGMFLPYTMFSGEEQMVDLVENWHNWTAPLLFATGFIKILMINCCVSGGWRGGSFFPCLFCATAIGYGLSTFILANQSFIVLTFMASYTAMALGQPLIIIALCMLFAPFSAILPITIAAFIGGFLNKKCMAYIVKSEEGTL